MIKNSPLIIALLSLLLLTQNALAQEKQLKAAALLGLTGGAAYQSEAVKSGLLLATEELQSEGWKVDLRYEDDQTNPTKTVSATQALLAQGYKYFIGPTWSFQINAARSLIEKQGALALIPTSSSDINGGVSEHIFNLCLPRTAQKEVVAKWLKQHSLKNALILTPLGDWGIVHREVFTEAVKESGGKVIAAEEYNYGIDSTTARALLLKYKNLGVEVILSTGGPGESAALLQARNGLKLPVHILGTADLSDAVQLGILSPRETAEKVSAISLSVDQNFRARYLARFNEEPKLYADRAYEALKLLAQAIANGNNDPVSVAKYLSTVKLQNEGKERTLFDGKKDSTSGRYQIVDLSQ